MHNWTLNTQLSALKFTKRLGKYFCFGAFTRWRGGSFFLSLKNSPEQNAKKWPHIAVLSAVIRVEFLSRPASVSHPVASSCRNIFTTFRTFLGAAKKLSFCSPDEYNPWHVVKQQQIYTASHFLLFGRVQPLSAHCHLFLCAPVLLAFVPQWLEFF